MTPECTRLAKEHGLAFVPPYDDPLVIAGQGTVGMEILKQVPDSEHLDAIFGAVGGGGLVAGICEYVKRIGSPHTRVIGVETFDGDAMARSLEKGERVVLSEVGPFSDGTAVRIVREEPFRICQTLLDGVVRNVLQRLSSDSTLTISSIGCRTGVLLRISVTRLMKKQSFALCACA